MRVLRRPDIESVQALDGIRRLRRRAVPDPTRTLGPEFEKETNHPAAALVAANRF